MTELYFKVSSWSSCKSVVCHFRFKFQNNKIRSYKGAVKCLVAFHQACMGLPQDFTSSPLGGSQLFFTGASWDTPAAVQCHVNAEMHSWTVLGRKGTFWTVCIWTFRSEPCESLQETREIYSVCFSGGDRHLMSLLSRRNTWYIKNSLVSVLSYRLAKTWVENKLSSSCQSKTHSGQTTTEGTAVGCGRMHFSYLWALWWWKRKRCNQSNSSLEREKKNERENLQRLVAQWRDNSSEITERNRDNLNMSCSRATLGLRLAHHTHSW